jgi:hypothetical protein
MNQKLGSPAMYEVAIINNRLVLGAADVNWKSKFLYSEAKGITRKMRDYRLAGILNQALRAFRTLKSNEDAQPHSQSLAMKRRAAIQEMRATDALITGNVTLRQAFKPAVWKVMLPCYFCQGMMGCTPAVEFSDDVKETNLTSARWDLRGDYAHSCAEIEVQLKALAM